MTKRIVYWTLGVALLPLLWASFREIVLMIPHVISEGIRTWWLYAVGGVAYLLLEKLLSKPMTLYVFGHELTHALSGLLSGARIHSFRAGSKGGEVRLSKANAFITLSPYVVPIYSLLIIALYALIRIWWSPPVLSILFQFMLGMTLAFHVSMTTAAIHSKQPDLKLMGIFLSGVLIAVGNAVILGLFCVSFFKKTPTFRDYALRLTRETAHVWQMSFAVAKDRINELYADGARPKIKIT